MQFAHELVAGDAEKTVCEEEIAIEQSQNEAGSQDIDRGWAWVVLFATWMSMVFLGCCLSSAGIIHLYLIAAFQESDIKTAWAGSLFSGLAHICGPLASWMSNRWSCRVSMFLGGLLGAGSLAISSQATALWMSFLTYGVMAGIGLGLIITPTLSVVGYYFKKRRSLACGLSVLGVPVGILAGPMCLTRLESSFGWRGSVLIFAGIQLNYCVIAVLCKPSILETQNRKFRPKHRSNLERLPEKYRFPKQLYTLITQTGCGFLIASIAFSNFGMSVIYMHLPKFTLEQGVPLDELQMIYLFMGLANMASKFLTGLGTGRVRSGESLELSCLLLGAYSASAVALLVLPSVFDSQTGRVVCVSLCAFYSNVEPPLYVPLTLRLVGLDSLNLVLGLEMFGVGAGFLTGPPVAAWIRGVSGDYKYSFYVAGISYVLSALSCLLVMKSKPPSNSPKHHFMEVNEVISASDNAE